MHSAGQFTNGVRLRAVLLFVLLLVTSAARAQTPFGSIDGVVQDSTGGVLPGVTVMVTSPALIEGTREVTTTDNGSYLLLRLPVGEYDVTYTLPGFQTLKRSKVVINADFTLTLNTELASGGLEETLTVVGASALVDVRNTTSQLSLDAKVVNLIPSSRNLTDMVKFVLGASQTAPDVGGSTSFSYTPMQIHGSRADQRALYIDGFAVNSYFGNGDAPMNFGGTGAKEETNFQTNAIPASFPVGGVVMNTITKSGGNELRGTLYANAQAGRFDNLDDDLRALGVRATSGSTGSYDIDGSAGGPIRRDKMWFFGAARVYSFSGLVANSFMLDGRQAYDYVRRWDLFEKTTLNLNASNKLVVSHVHDTLLRPYRRDSQAFYTIEANVLNYYTPNYQPMVSWTGTRGNAFLYEVQVNHWFRNSLRSYRPEVGPNDVTHFDIVRNTYSVAGTTVTNTLQRGTNIGGSVTRVGNWKGSHQVRAGAQFSGGNHRNEWEPHGDMILRFRDGVPDSITQFSTPSFNKTLIRSLGTYVQDSWGLGRMTINAGARYDYFTSSLPAQSAPAGTWVGARSYDARPVISWHNVVPRLGVAYDLTGDARTVVKGSYSRYIFNQGAGLADAVNPMSQSTSICSWSDTNGDRYAQVNEVSRCAGFPELNIALASDLDRPVNTEYSLGIQRQLTGTFAGSMMYYRRENRGNYATANTAVPRDSYLPVVITNPLTSTPLTIYNQAPSTTGLQRNVIMNSALLNDTFNGVEFSLQRRFGGDSYLQGGYAWGRDFGRINTGDLNDPNNDINTQGVVGSDQTHQLKVSAATTLPYSVTLSAFYQYYTGLPRQRILSVSRALVPSLTRATQNIALEANNSFRYDNVSLVDLRLGRRFAVGRWQLEGFLDAYNLLNANTVLSTTNTIGSALGSVLGTVSPRLMRVGGKFSF